MQRPPRRLSQRMRNNRNINPSWTVSSSIRVAPRCSPASDCGQSVTNFGFNLETTKEKEMKISQTYPAALTATHTNDSAPQKPKSVRRGLMQRLGFAFLACALAIGATGTASAGSARDEGAVRGLGDAFANAFVQKNAELRASLFAEDGTFVTPQGDFLQGRVAMVKEFGAEAQNVNGPDGTIIPVIPIDFFYVAVRHADKWLIQDGRAHFAAAPPSGMTKSSR